MIYGYERVSTDEQDAALQTQALERAGCEAVGTDHLSAKNLSRPGLRAVLAALKPRDTLVVWKLDRLSRKTTEALGLIEALLKRGVKVKILDLPSVDFNSAAGQAMLGVQAVFAQFERAQISERTKAGMAVAKARGKQIGGVKTTGREEEEEIHRLRSLGLSVLSIARSTGFGRQVIRRVLAEV